MTEIGLRDALLMRRETEGPAAAGEREAAEHGDLAGEFPEEALLGEAEAVMALGRAQGFGEPYLIAPGVEATLHPAGHALGSAWVRLDIDGGGTLAVSGDLGRHGHVLLRSPAPFTDADAVLVEAAYGEGRRPATDDRDHLAHVVFTTLDKGGTVLVPAGPVDHIATVLYELARLRRVGCLPDGVSVYFDGPTGLDAVGVWRDALLAGDRELCDEVLAFGPAAFDAGVLGGVRSPEASRHLRRAEGPRVIIAGPHHGDGGRAGQHLLRLLPDERNAVILQGRAPVGSAAHALARGAEVVRIGKAMVPVHAQIAHLPGMTTHADAGEIVEWLGHGREPGTTYVVHGTPEARTALCDRIRRTLGWHTENPSGNASFTLR
ncbi:MAG: MBL fold metallo-hydrolase [Streptomycetaceae bacterium]|nr:MBL fold metallo-hydrolase [Streptomycetaceae bacterium]